MDTYLVEHTVILKVCDWVEVKALDYESAKIKAAEMLPATYGEYQYQEVISEAFETHYLPEATEYMPAEGR